MQSFSPLFGPAVQPHSPSIMLLLPKPPTTAKLFLTGAVVGPLVDSLHNQVLLRYEVLPIQITIPQPPAASFFSSEVAAAAAADPIVCTSWLIPPLLGVAYVILGGILPRVMENVIVVPMQRVFNSQGNRVKAKPTSQQLQTRAVTAVVTTALIIKLSELLQAHSLPLLPDGYYPDSEQSLAIMLFAALGQWLLLDGTPAALLAASITSIGGPLSELPFVAGGFWHYIPSAADYLPLASLPESGGGGLLVSLAKAVLGDGYNDLALSSITGPCYFAVTMDSIALGRWFDAQDGKDEIF